MMKPIRKAMLELQPITEQLADNEPLAMNQFKKVHNYVQSSPCTVLYPCIVLCVVCVCVGSDGDRGSHQHCPVRSQAREHFTLEKVKLAIQCYTIHTHET